MSRQFEPAEPCARCATGHYLTDDPNGCACDDDGPACDYCLGGWDIPVPACGDCGHVQGTIVTAHERLARLAAGGSQ